MKLKKLSKPEVPVYKVLDSKYSANLETKIDCKSVKHTGDIFLFQQFFIHRNNERYEEIKYCLKKNAENKYINTIYLLNERIYSQIELGINDDDMKKIKQINIGKRITYKYVFDYVKSQKLEGYIVLSNSDIYLDDTITNIFNTSLYSGNCWYSQLRIEDNDKKPECPFKSSMFNVEGHNIKIGIVPTYTIENDKIVKKLFAHPNSKSQDTWIYHTNGQLKNTSGCDFELGKPGCDLRISYEIHSNNKHVFNDPLYIKTFHVHSSQVRDYVEKDTIPGPYLELKPIFSKEYWKEKIEPINSKLFIDVYFAQKLLEFIKTNKK